MSYLQSVTTHIWFICNWTRFLSSELSVFSHLVLQAEMQGIKCNILSQILNDSLIACTTITDFHLRRFSFDLPYHTFVF